MTRHADWYFDYVSPYAYLQLASFARLPPDLEVRLRPVLFAGLLGHWETKGPAEIPAKRRQTYRYCHWLAGKRGVPFKAPPRHPFNPLALLRLTLVLDAEVAAVRRIFHHVWGEGRDGQDPEALAALVGDLGVADWESRIAAPAVKQALRDSTEQAVARGVYGIPTFVVGDEVFWGDDTTDMMLEYLADPAMFARGELARLGDLPEAARRKESRL